MAIPATIRRSVEERDKGCCAYCLTLEANCGLPMHVDHIVPEKVGGTTTLDNLCLACWFCNLHKAARQTGIDIFTQNAAPLFHPLQQQWYEHFSWDENKTQIIGLTPTGRATIAALQMNNAIVVAARRRWVSVGWHPPKD